MTMRDNSCNKLLSILEEKYYKNQSDLKCVNNINSVTGKIKYNNNFMLGNKNTDKFNIV